MPARDAGAWIGEAIESIRAQTLEDWELIAVDDGSNDDTPKVLAEHAGRDARIRVFSVDAAHRGIVAALNRGLRESRGCYVARMDADDVAHPDRLTAQTRALDDDASLAAVSCRVEGFPPETMGPGMRRYLAWQNELLTPADISRDRFVESPVVAPSLMVRTGVLRRTLRGWHERGWPEDWDLVLRTIDAGGRIARVPRVLHRWRQHARQTTHTDPRYGADRLLRVRAHFLARHLRGQVAMRAPWILGAGPVGKSLAEALSDQGLIVAGFAEIDPRKIGNRVRRAGHWWPVISMEEMHAARATSYAVAAVGRAGARVRIREALVSAGWIEGDDFVVAA